MADRVERPVGRVCRALPPTRACSDSPVGRGVPSGRIVRGTRVRLRGEIEGQVLQSPIGRERETASVTLEKDGFRHLFSEEKEPDPAPGWDTVVALRSRVGH
jgi:hypothetical protein